MVGLRFEPGRSLWGGGGCPFEGVGPYSTVAGQLASGRSRATDPARRLNADWRWRSASRDQQRAWLLKAPSRVSDACVCRKPMLYIAGNCIVFTYPCNTRLDLV